MSEALDLCREMARTSSIPSTGRHGRCCGYRAALLVSAVMASPLLAGGGGQNMLLVVNPNDENAVRVAQAYMQTRNISSSNIIFITPPTISNSTVAKYEMNDGELVTQYIQPIQAHLAAKGLTGQIDYIATLGQPLRAAKSGSYGSISLSTALMRMDTLAAGISGGSISTTAWNNVYSGSSPVYESGWSQTSGYDSAANEAVRHSTSYASGAHPAFYRGIYYYSSTSYQGGQVYMGGILSHTGFNGLTADEAINSLNRSASADGTKPAGTVYFEENDDTRSTTREPDWPEVQAELTKRHIAWIQENNVPGNAPKNRSDVRGAVLGAAGMTLPNGSTYLPGSWADSLTSYGAMFDQISQTKLTEVLRSGAAASSGTITEPYADSYRFPNGMNYIYQADGSTQAEAFYKSIRDPSVITMAGDMLGQPYADVPNVLWSNAPTDGSKVSGTVSVQASATVTSSATTTGIGKLQLWIDGKLSQTVASAANTFNIDTTGLSDGIHEVRIVAMNNSAAESEGYVLKKIVVNNHGRSVAAAAQVTVAPTGTAEINVTANKGDGLVRKVQLWHMGRLLGTVNTNASGNIPIDSSLLSYGDNAVTPVAVFADGTQVAGQAITVTREKPWIQGQSVAAQKQAGIKAEYFLGKGGSTIASSDFTGTPDIVTTHSKASLWSGLKRPDGNNASNLVYPEMMATKSIDKLAIRLSGEFQITTEGEYHFYSYQANDAARLNVDGQTLYEINGQSWGATSLWSQGMFLKRGQHSFELLAANIQDAHDMGNFFNVSIYFQGPDGLLRVLDSSMAYVAIPEPASLTLLAFSGAMLAWGRQRREA